MINEKSLSKYLTVYVVGLKAGWVVNQICTEHPFYETYTNSADPDKNAVCDQSSTFAYRYFNNNLNLRKTPPNNPKLENELVQLIKMGKSIRLKWANSHLTKCTWRLR